MEIINGGICAAQGFTAGGIHCGIRKNKTKKDLSLIFSEKRAAAAAVYTTNLVKGAPLVVTKNMQKYDLPILFGIYLLLALFAFVITPGTIQVWEACILFSLTIIYTIFLILA